jgi:hypothetical protein
VGLDGAGQPHDAEAEPVLAPFGDLFDQLAVLERDDKPKRRGLVHIELFGQLGDARFA